MNCKECGIKLTSDDIGAYRKFWNRDSGEISCIPCLCAKLRCTEKYLRERVQFLKDNGCSLFPDRNKFN